MGVSVASCSVVGIGWKSRREKIMRCVGAALCNRGSVELCVPSRSCFAMGVAMLSCSHHVEVGVLPFISSSCISV